MWYRDQTYTIPKYIKKEIEKKNTNTQFPLNSKKHDLRPPRHLAELSIWRSALGALDMNSKLIL